MFEFYEFVSYIGGFIRAISLLLFGIATGWFTLNAFRQPERKWHNLTYESLRNGNKYDLNRIMWCMDS